LFAERIPENVGNLIAMHYTRPLWPGGVECAVVEEIKINAENFELQMLNFKVSITFVDFQRCTEQSSQQGR